MKDVVTVINRDAWPKKPTKHTTEKGTMSTISDLFRQLADAFDAQAGPNVSRPIITNTTGAPAVVVGPPLRENGTLLEPPKIDAISPLVTGAKKGNVLRRSNLGPMGTTVRLIGKDFIGADKALPNVQLYGATLGSMTVTVEHVDPDGKQMDLRRREGWWDEPLSFHVIVSNAAGVSEAFYFSVEPE